MANTERYNGWTNYATWNVALWIGNDEAIYQRLRSRREPWTPAAAERFARNCFPGGTPDLRDRREPFAGVNWSEIADSWNAE